MRASLLTALAVVVTLIPSIGAAQQCTTDARRVVDAVYQQMLGRSAGTEGASRAQQLTAGETNVRELVREVAMSPEHRRRFLSESDRRGAVRQLYLHILGREPDPDGLRAHVDALGGQNIDQVIESMLNSPEYQNAYGFDIVPGSRVAFCGPNTPSQANAAPVSRRFPGMDRNRNGVIERAEWNGSDQSFNVHDWNRDGVLSGEEVHVGRARTPRDLAEMDFPAFEPPAWTRDSFVQMDRNRDNRISSGEWFYDSEAFWRADRDRNGFLSLGEFTAPGDDDRSDSFENLDVNRNGRIERGEWHSSFDAFQWLDRNRDNVLSRAEVAGETTTPNRFDSFVSIDTDGSRSITPNEWRWSRRSFDRLDANGDGIVSRQEFAVGAASGASAIPR